MLAEDHRSVAFGHEVDRWGAPEEDVALGLDTDLAESPHEPEETFDNLVARYFGDVRQFALLNRAEEQALWCRIESAQKRDRRALYTVSCGPPYPYPVVASGRARRSRSGPCIARCGGIGDTAGRPAGAV